MDFPAAFGGIDMNDPSNLSLGMELIQFQTDLSKSELRQNNPDTSKQRILQSIAHGLGLEYEYSLKTREATISRSANATSDQVKRSGFDLGDEPLDRISNDWPRTTEDAELDGTTAIANDLGSFSQFGDLIFGNNEFNVEDFGWNFGSGEQEANVMVGESSELPHTLDILPDFPNEQNLLDNWDKLFEPTQISLDSNHPYVDRSSIQNDLLIPQSFDLTVGGVFGSSEMQTCNEYPSASAIRDPDSSSIASFLKGASGDLSDCWSETSICNSWNDSSRRGSRSESRMRSGMGSRSNSISSLNSERARGRLSSTMSRRPSTSIHRTNSSTRFQELVFDSNPSRANSTASSCSKRHKPLDSVARAAIKAVKAISACWRCRFLRKQCDLGSPCDACPKGTQKSRWGLIGCNRGNLKTEVIPIPLCPQSHPGYSLPSETLSDEKGEGLRARANDCLKEASDRRPKETSVRDDLTPTRGETDPFISNLQKQWNLLSPAQAEFISSLRHPYPAKLIPLDQCILDIFWEAFDCPLSHTIIGSAGDLIMLRAAAMYQAKSETGQLIAQTLICLRSCLEALRIKQSGFLEERIHQDCESSICKVDCIANITSSLELYLDELSRVFFKKENMRNKSWWLSVFYSFCIQSIVRHALLRLIGITSEPATQPTLGATQHLHLAVRLFIATSGSYDPLMLDYAKESDHQSEEEADRIRDYELAQYASYKHQWPYFGIKSTSEFLEHLFEI